MRISYFLGLVALVLNGCSHRDPIDRLMAEIPNESVPSYLFKPILLPDTASPELLISNLIAGGNFHGPTILEIRRTHTMPPSGSGIRVENFTAVLLDAHPGHKIVVLRPMETNRWYYKIYDAK